MDKPSITPESKAHSVSDAESSKYIPKYDVETVDVDSLDSSRVRAVGFGDAEVKIDAILEAREKVNSSATRSEKLDQARELANAMLDGTAVASDAKNKDRVKKWKGIVEKSLIESDDDFKQRAKKWVSWHLDKHDGKYPTVDDDGNKGTKVADKLVEPDDSDPAPTPEPSSESVSFDDLSPDERAALGLDVDNDPDGDDPEASTGPESDVEAMERLNALRKIKAQAMADKIKAPVYRKSRREAAMSRFEEAQALYMSEYQERFRAELERRAADESVSDDDLRRFIERSVNNTVRLEREANRQATVEAYGKLGKALEWYSRQGRGKKIAIGIGVGALGLGVGAAVGFLGGLLGTGVAAAGAFGVTNRGAKQYFMQLSEIFKETEHSEFSLEEGMSRSDMVASAADRASYYIGSDDVEMIKNAENAKRKAVKWAIGSAALVGASGVVGTAIHVASMDAPSGKPWHVLGGQTEHVIREQFEQPAPQVIDQPTVREAVSAPVTQVEIQRDSVLDVDSYIAERMEAQHIARGEGWYRTFKELGMDPQERRAFLKEYGDELLEMRDDRGRPIAYRMKNGDIGIARPGEMPRDVLDFIVRTAHDKGYIEVDTRIIETRIEVPAEPLSVSWQEQAVTLTPNESISNTLNEFQNAGLLDPNISAEAFSAIVQQTGSEIANYTYPNGVPVVYKDIYGEWRFNVVNGGVYSLPEEVLRNLREAALRNRYTLAA